MSSRNQMTVNGLSCVLHNPPAVKSTYDAAGNEIDAGLPPGTARPAYNVADYGRYAPEEWDRGGPGVGSYFVGVGDKTGLWLDFNANNSHGHDVAAVISIQGVNALTGGRTQGRLGLEQYEEGQPCPKHGDPFETDRLCRTCGYKWPAQNYLCTSGVDMPSGYFWLDGFRAEDGAVRQFVFTTEKKRGVAAQLIGEERVHLLGIAFFLSKKEKPMRTSPYRRLGGGGLESMGPSDMLGGGLVKCGARRMAAAPSMEVAAGARVKQQVYEDPYRLSYWQRTTAGVLYVNYTDQDTVQEIIGERTGPSGRSEGFLGGSNVGYPGGDEQ